MRYELATRIRAVMLAKRYSEEYAYKTIGCAPQTLYRWVDNWHINSDVAEYILNQMKSANQVNELELTIKKSSKNELRLEARVKELELIVKNATQILGETTVS